MALLQTPHRVLIYTTCYNVLDGVTLTIRKLEQEILAAGHSLCILTTLSGDKNNTHLDGEHANRTILFMDNGLPIPFLHDPNDPDLTYQIGFSLSKVVRAQIEDFEPSIIHITVPDCTALHLIELARTKEIPLMGTYHSNIPEYMDHYPGLEWLKPILGSFFRHQYNFLQALYVPTPFIENHLIDHYQLDQATKLGIWGRGVDIETFHPEHKLQGGADKFRAQLGISMDTVILCWVGRLVPEKRVDIFCDTVRRLHDQGLNFHAVVIGAGPSEEEVKTLPNTTFCGWMNANQLAVAYASSDVFLFPSSVETFGNVTLEAMASGLPVVVESGCSGHLVEEGVNGYAIPVGDADAFFEATAELVRDENKRRHYSKAGRAKAEMLEKSSVVRLMLQNYQTLTQEFYTEFGGRHVNRDAQYKFQGGNCPRPTALVLVEYLFIVLFQVLWRMSQMLVWAQDTIVKKRGGTAVIATANTVTLQDTISTKPNQSDPLLQSTDDNDEEAQSAASTSTKDSLSKKTRSGGCCQNIPMALAIAFIKSVELVCLMESMARNGASSAYKLPRGIIKSMKRKNSFDQLMKEPRSVRRDSNDGGSNSRSNSRHGISSSLSSVAVIRPRQRGGSTSGANLLEIVQQASIPLGSNHTSSCHQQSSSLHHHHHHQYPATASLQVV